MENINLQFNQCSTCNGTGFLNKKTCSTCGGAGIGVYFQKRFFYFGKKISQKSILQDKVKKYFYLGIKIFCAIIGGFGVLALLYNLFTIKSVGFFFSVNYLLAFFWISVVFDLFLFYLFIKENSQKQNVILKTYSKIQNSENEGFFDWNNFKKSSNKIDISKAFSEQALESLKNSFLKALEFNHETVDETHVLNSLPNFNRMLLIFGRLEINLDQFKELTNKIFRSQIKVTPIEPYFDLEIKKKLIKAYFEAYFAHRQKVDLAELLLVMADSDKKHVKDLLFDLDISKEKIKNVVEWLRIQDILSGQYQKLKSMGKFRPKSGLDRAMTAVTTPLLDTYSEDLTKFAAHGSLYPVIDREKEIEEIFRIIEGGRDSVILVGKEGVGKTSVIEAIAQKMIRNEVPEFLREKRLVALSIPHLLSGENGESPGERLNTIIYEIMRSGNVILVVENIQHLIGEKTLAGENLGLADILAETIKRKNIIVIASSQEDKYSEIIEKSVFSQSLIKVNIPEPNKNLAIQILQEHSSFLEAKHKVYYSYNSIENIVNLSQKYIHEKYLPQKAMQLLSEAAIYVKNKKGENSLIRGEDASELLSKKLNMPLTKVTAKESEKLIDLEKRIHERVIGQDEAVKAVAESLRRARTELRAENRPIANLLFIGPTGVGKTELAKTVAEAYYGNEQSMVRLDMSQFQESSSINSLVGAPKGYEGSSAGGYLTEGVRKNPYTLVLLDELEKAHPDVLNLFLQVMEDGRLSDSSGKVIDFTNAIIIATSNAGTMFIQEKLQENVPLDTIKQLMINDVLMQYFRPEFLNRFDGIILLKPLNLNEIEQICSLMLKKVQIKMEEKEIDLEFSKETISQLAQQGYDPQYGARPLRRLIQDKVENALAEALLKGEISRGDTVEFKLNGELDVTHRK